MSRLACLDFGAVSRSRFLWACVVLSTLLGPSFAQTRDIVVGQTLALTGPASAIATELMRGRQACVDLVNSQGMLHGRSLRLLTRNDQNDPARAVHFAQELADREGAAVFLGSMGPAVNTAILRWANDAGMAVIDPHGGDVETRIGAAQTAYFLTANQSAEAERLAAHVVALGLSRVAIAYATDEAGQTALNAFEEGLSVASVTAIAMVPLKPDGTDAGEVARRVSKANPQAVLLATTGKATVAMLRALGTGGIPLLQVYGLSSSASAAELAELGSRSRGFSMTQVVPAPRDTRSPVVAMFQSAMRNVPGERTSAELEGCMSVLLLAEALRRNPIEPTRAAILQAMRTAGRVNLGGFEVDLADRVRPGSRFTEIVYVGADGRISR